jgi:hypothetical protein
VPFTESIPVAVPAELPQFIRHFDAGRLGYDANPFTPAAQALAA